MEQGKKKCPYCGEEIKAEAKKCKHCGEWLEPKVEQNTEATPSGSENQVESKLSLVKRVKEATGVSLSYAKEAVDATGDFYKAMAYIQEKGPQEEIPASAENVATDIGIPDFQMWVNICFWVAVLGGFINMIQDWGLLGGLGRWDFLIQVADILPYWLTLFVSFIGEAGLIYLLMLLTKKMGEPIGNIGYILMIFLAMGCFYNYMVTTLPEESDLATYGLLFILATMVCYVVIGIMLFKNYTNAMKGLGIILILYPIITIVYVLLSTASLTLAANIPIASFIITAAYLYAFKDSLLDAYNTPQEDFSYGPLMAMGFGIFASVIMLWGLGMFDSSVSSSSDNSEEVFDDTDSINVIGEKESTDNDDCIALINDLDRFVDNTRECIEDGVPSTSTLGSHYEEARQGLWRRYHELETRFSKDQQEYAYALLQTIDNLFDDWMAQEYNLNDYDNAVAE